MSEALEEETVVVEPEAVLEPEEQPSFAASSDPRAMAAIRRAKGFGGLFGFIVTGLAAHMHGELMASMLFRALAGGVAGYMVAWLAAVTIWRRIIRAELRHTVEAIAARHRAAQADTQS